MKHSILNDDPKVRQEMFSLRQQGWSSAKLAQKYNVHHSTTLAICKKYGVKKVTADKIIIFQKIETKKECASSLCKKIFIAKTKRHIYCCRECLNVAYFGIKIIPPPKFTFNEKEEKVCLGYNYADYLAKAYPDYKKRKAIMKAKKWGGLGAPQKTMSEYKKERDKLTEQRIQHARARQERLAGVGKTIRE